jgi:hypothetical protein
MCYNQAGGNEMTKPKDKHENWGGKRKASPGKRIGRPRKGKSLLTRLDVRVPPEWIAAITTHGGGSFAEGVRRIITESGVVSPS